MKKIKSLTNSVVEFIKDGFAIIVCLPTIIYMMRVDDSDDADIEVAEW